MSLKRHLSYAHGYLELGLLAEAAAELDKVSPDQVQDRSVLGLRMALLHETEDWASLAKFAANFVAQAPDEVSAWITWAYATRRCESLAAAENILRAAERRHPSEATIQFNLGCYACVRGDLIEARRRLNRAIALEPKFRAAAAKDPDFAALHAAEGKARSA